MMLVRPVSTLLFLASGILSARSADDGLTQMESCFQAARIADSICSKLSHSPVRAAGCFQTARTAELECLDHILSGPRAEPSTPQSPGSPASGPPNKAEAPETPSTNDLQDPLDRTEWSTRPGPARHPALVVCLILGRRPHA